MSVTLQSRGGSSRSVRATPLFVLVCVHLRSREQETAVDHFVVERSAIDRDTLVLHQLRSRSLITDRTCKSLSSASRGELHTAARRMVSRFDDEPVVSLLVLVLGCSIESSVVLS